MAGSKSYGLRHISPTNAINRRISQSNSAASMGLERSRRTKVSARVKTVFESDLSKKTKGTGNLTL